jgi:hypothetical protein
LAKLEWWSPPLSAKVTHALADVLVGEKAKLSIYRFSFQNPRQEMNFSYSEPAKRTLLGSDLIGLILLLIEGITGVIIFDWKDLVGQGAGFTLPNSNRTIFKETNF